MKGCSTARRGIPPISAGRRQPVAHRRLSRGGCCPRHCVSVPVCRCRGVSPFAPTCPIRESARDAPRRQGSLADQGDEGQRASTEVPGAHLQRTSDRVAPGSIGWPPVSAERATSHTRKVMQQIRIRGLQPCPRRCLETSQPRGSEHLRCCWALPAAASTADWLNTWSRTTTAQPNTSNCSVWVVDRICRTRRSHWTCGRGPYRSRATGPGPLGQAFWHPLHRCRVRSRPAKRVNPSDPAGFLLSAQAPAAGRSWLQADQE